MSRRCRRPATGTCGAPGRHTGSSDTDVLVVYADPPRADAFHLVRWAMSLRGVEPHVYARSELAAVAGVVARMTEGGVVVYEAPSGAVP